MRIFIILFIIAIIGFLARIVKRNKKRNELGTSVFTGNEAKYVNDPRFGRDKDFAIVVKNPDVYLQSLVTEDGKHITWKFFQEFKTNSENYDSEQLTITAFGIFVDEEYTDKFYFYCGGLENSKNAPSGYRVETV